jgi:hypothetical protein
MDDLARAFADPAVRGWYLAFCFALLVLPMVAMAIWYHLNIKKTPGGRALMDEQNSRRVRAHGSPGDAIRNLVHASGMAGDIASGKYGVAARTMQTRVYWISGAWLAANVVAFGLLLWADEVNRAVSP